eukprot:1159539-Prymnesium_polylepis.2
MPCEHPPPPLPHGRECAQRKEWGQGYNRPVSLEAAGDRVSDGTRGHRDFKCLRHLTEDPHSRIVLLLARRYPAQRLSRHQAKAGGWQCPVRTA